MGYSNDLVFATAIWCFPAESACRRDIERGTDMRLAVIKRRFEELRRQAYWDIAPLPKMQKTTCIYVGPGKYVDWRDHSPISSGEVWADPGETAFLEFSGDFSESNHWFDISLGGEACLFVDGVPYAGLDENHRLVPIPEGYHQFKIEAFNNKTVPQKLARAHIVSIDWDLDNLTNIALQAVKLGEVSGAVIAEAFEDVLTRVLVHLAKAQDRQNLVQAALEMLDDELEKFRHNKLPGKLVLIPQSHIDLAWLWPEKETVRKTSRTFSTALRLSEMYDEFVYHQSQPQLFLHAKTYYPELYEEIKDAVKTGRFQLVGGMWVEPDCNMPSGEAFVRQILYGKKFFQDEFGVVPTVEWLPDVFGFSPSLPQLLKDSGTEAFMTIKTGWNDTNKMPDGVFNWRGIDGSRIPVFIPRALNEDVTVTDVLQAMENAKRTTAVAEVAHLMGYGDGGGGVTFDQMNKGRLLAKLPALPRIEFGNINSYVKESILNRPIKHTWDGELYLELHRGTTTTQARNKKWNRKLEFKIRDVEILSSLAYALGADYPQAEIEDAWKVILKNQMHDILPGSSINEVYEDSEKDYTDVDNTLEGLKVQAADRLAMHIANEGNGNALKSFVIFNTLSFSRTALVEIADLPENVRFVDANGNDLTFQRLTSGKVLVEVDLPEMGYTVIDVIEGEEKNLFSPFELAEREMRNGQISVLFGEDGRIAEIRDLTSGESVVKNSRHHLQLFDDRPLQWDAWEIDVDYQDINFEPELVSFRVKENGPLFASVEGTWRFNRSVIVQEIVLYRDSKRVDFKTNVDWKEKHVLLKTTFDTSIRTRFATFDVAFGKYQRPTFQNTTWERAQFEVAGHKWADLSDAGHGVSLLNDCKYGYSVSDGSLSLSLLRAPTYPDPEADMGVHEFTYSILVHDDPTLEQTIKEAYNLNLYPVVRELSYVKERGTQGLLPREHSFVKLGSRGILLDTIKLAERSSDFVFRFFETLGMRQTLEIEKGLAMSSETDLLENPRKQKIDAVFGPFKVKTFIGRLEL